MIYGQCYDQVLAIDAHNHHPSSAAMFSAAYCRALPGHGPLRLDWAGMNAEQPWSCAPMATSL